MNSMINAIGKENEINGLDNKEMEEDTENKERKQTSAMWGHTKPTRD